MSETSIFLNHFLRVAECGFNVTIQWCTLTTPVYVLWNLPGTASRPLCLLRCGWRAREGIWNYPVRESKISKWAMKRAQWPIPSTKILQNGHVDLEQWLSRVDPRLDPSIMPCKGDQKETENYYLYCTYDWQSALFCQIIIIILENKVNGNFKFNQCCAGKCKILPSV
jgi:hypothetical protein